PMSRTAALSAVTASCLLALPAPVVAVADAALDEVVITATRIPERVGVVPAAISVVSGRELAERGAADLGAALALVSGVEAPAGGDAGPSSAVPSFWGLHEFDAFLLVVDGVPWGGAYNPAITTLNLNDVERIEVLKGAAPVMYGATSFVGVIQAIHHPAGEAADAADLAYGTYGSWRGSLSAALPPVGDYRQSIAVDGQRTGFADARALISDGRLLYRGALDLGGGRLTVDLDVTHVHDVPTSPVLRTGPALSAVTPLDANFNPADARIDENRYHVSIGYARPTAWGTWETLASYAYSDVTDIRAFLHPDLSGVADTQDQRRRIDDAYFDTHLAHEWPGDAHLLLGADLLYGRARQTTDNGNDAYTVPLDGSVLPPPTSPGIVTEIGTLADRRWFVGQYAQLDWKPGARWDLVAGVRLNETYERKASSDLSFPPPDLLAAEVSKTVVRPSETVGASYRAWQQGSDRLVVFADYRNAFKPAAIDFGPDYTPDLLSPETAQSWEAGLKGTLLQGRLSYQAEAFLLDFRNLVVATESGALANAGGERLKGVELESRLLVTPGLELLASAAYHDARFSSYVVYDGETPANVAGRQLVLSPHVLASAGLLLTPARGLGASLVARYVGPRYLDEQNTAPVGGYATLDASLSYAWQRMRVSLEGTNLTDRRPPVTASEFGSQSIYLLPARMAWLRLGYCWK
ncbi:MAG: TonB-dependent receptor, partial [Proteobacteria bacterium]|nr:TonB-dependent receptor [Pseudomonadota bacterium]